MDWSDGFRTRRQRITHAVEQADVKRILSDVGLTYKEKGIDLWFRCFMPEHQDRDPSAKITANRENSHHGVWHCFGCQCSGNIITLVAAVTHRSFQEALTYVEARFHDSASSWKQKEEFPDTPIVLPREYEFYEDPRQWNPPYVEYLDSRGILWSQVIRHRIGYCDEGPYERRIIIPVKLGRELRTWIGRAVWGHNQRVTSCPGGKPGLFGSELASPSRGPAFLCEGWADALAIERAGYANALSLQTNTIHQDQLDFLSKFPVIFLVPDGDQGGNGLINSASTIVAQSDVFVVRLPTGTDPASLSEQGRERELISSIENAERWQPYVRDWIDLIIRD